jgi:predicted transcriptional regulator
MRISNTTGDITFTGSVTATSFFESSDMRLKTIVEENYKSIGVENIKPKLYTKNGNLEVGYFAQELQDIIPTSVSISDEGFLNLSYTQVHTMKIAYLEDSIDEIRAKILNLENQLKQTQNENN